MLAVVVAQVAAAMAVMVVKTTFIRWAVMIRLLTVVVVVVVVVVVSARLRQSAAKRSKGYGTVRGHRSNPSITTVGGGTKSHTPKRRDDVEDENNED